jgi:hypothetical protein
MCCINESTTGFIEHCSNLLEKRIAQWTGRRQRKIEIRKMQAQQTNSQTSRKPSKSAAADALLGTLPKFLSKCEMMSFNSRQLSRGGAKC